ncbi:MAG: dihydrofolate reductase family protein [Isosphaeraceae bacterium]
MRRLCFNAAVSLDGYIAGPGGEYDWIIMDPAIDFQALYERFDCLLMGRHTYKMSAGQTTGGTMFGKRIVVISGTMKASDHPGLEIIRENVAARVGALKAEPGRDIWLFGGGVLFSSLLGSGLVDTVELAVIPVLLGDGIPMLPPPGARGQLRLTSSQGLLRDRPAQLRDDPLAWWSPRPVRAESVISGRTRVAAARNPSHGGFARQRTSGLPSSTELEPFFPDGSAHAGPTSGPTRSTVTRQPGRNSAMIPSRMAHRARVRA